MATGVKPRDEESTLTRSDLEAIQDAMKNKKFRDLLTEYCDEVRDPANQAIYQKEMTQLEKERGYDVTFINPKGGYVIKTSVAGDRKAFINICSNDNVDKPSCSVQEQNGQKGMNWQLPYTIIPPREDFNNKRERCIIYDVVFHPDTLRMAEVNKRFRELVNKTAFDGLQKTYDIHFDSNNCRFPKASYKGMTVPAVIRKEDPNFKPSTDEENPEVSQEILDKLYPQHMYSESKDHLQEKVTKEEQHRKKAKNSKKEFTHSSDKGYTVPKYVIKQQKNVDFQDFTYHKDSKQYSAIPSNLTIEINLPLLSSTKDCVLDVREKSLTLVSEKPAKYKLNLTLPYPVNDDSGNATFDKSKHLLIVTLPVIRKNISSSQSSSFKGDSGVESEENSNSEEETCRKVNRVEEITSSNEKQNPSLTQEKEKPINNDEFLLPNIGYTFPPYTYNALDDVIAFTFHVKNTEADSVEVKNVENKVYIKFSSVGAGFVPIHYAALIVFDHNIHFENATGEAWDNNVILQLETAGDVSEKFQIGLKEDDLKTEYFDVSKLKKSAKSDMVEHATTLEETETSPVVEVTNLGSETNIVVSSTPHIDDTEDENEKDIVWVESNTSEVGAKSILRKPITMMRSYSESSFGDVASSMDYISSDCIPEESSLKKHVRFSDVIAKQFYRYNSSIEGQKRKNQRKKSKKRNLERRKSESEAEDDTSHSVQTPKSRLKSALKQRHDSGLADTSDAEECKYNMSDCDQYDSNADENANKNEVDNKSNDSSQFNIIDRNGNSKENQHPTWKSMSGRSKKTKNIKDTPITCNNIKHNTDLYNPDNLNKGKYLEVKFKNDLIFDLDM